MEKILSQSHSSSISDDLYDLHTLFALANIEVNGSRPWDIQIAAGKGKILYRRLIHKGSFGLGETYMEGLWDCEKIDALIYHLIKANLAKKVQFSPFMVLPYIKGALLNLQTKALAQKWVRSHYDIGDDLYKYMLESTMAYSCGYWKDAKNLTEAQYNKFELINRKLYLEPEMSLLDVGCGWGGYLQHTVKTHKGINVHGITIAKNQFDEARRRVGYDAIKLEDYRDIRKTYNRIVSIGMFEHVGPKNYRRYMETIHKHLAPDGLFLLHTIVGNERATTTDPWLNKYIFPGSVVPSFEQIAEAFDGIFTQQDVHYFGLDYDKTLMAWFNNFKNYWPFLEATYGEKQNGQFKRMWKYYLLSCAGSFRAEKNNLCQLVLSKGNVAGGYVPVR